MKRPAAVAKRPATLVKKPAALIKRPSAKKLPPKLSETKADEAVSNLRVACCTLRPGDIMFGGIWIGYGPAACAQDPGQLNADATVAAAVDAGIVEFDTAPWYGAGSSEERLGRAVAQLPPEAGVRVITKAGRLFRQPDGVTPCAASVEISGSTSVHDRVVTNDYTAHGARVSLSESLARMRMESVYGLRIHDPNDNSTCDGSVDEVGVALEKDGMCAEFRRMREAGTIEHIGLGMNCNREAHQGVPDEIIRLIRGTDPGTFDSALLAGGWNLLSQDGLHCLYECEKQGIAVHIAGVFASGLLVGGSTYAYAEASAEMQQKANRWRELAHKHRCSLPAVAIAFSALPACVTRVVIGMGTVAQVQQNMRWVAESNNVPSAVWREAKHLGLLNARVPIPS